jgi:hypothetical protein
MWQSTRPRCSALRQHELRLGPKRPSSCTQGPARDPYLPTLRSIQRDRFPRTYHRLPRLDPTVEERRNGRGFLQHLRACAGFYFRPMSSLQEVPGGSRFGCPRPATYIGILESMKTITTVPLRSPIASVLCWQLGRSAILSERAHLHLRAPVPTFAATLARLGAPTRPSTHDYAEQPCEVARPAPVESIPASDDSYEHANVLDYHHEIRLTLRRRRFLQLLFRPHPIRI